jgi:hypothetical protein
MLVTQKPAESSMGKEKGVTEDWEEAMKPGILCFEDLRVSFNFSGQGFRWSDFKKNFRCGFVDHGELESN